MKTELNSRREPLILFKRVMGDDSVGLRPPVGPSGPCETLSQDAEWAVSESHSSIFLTITSCTTPLSQVWHVLIRDSNSYILSFSSVNAQRSLSVQSVWALSLTCRILTMSWLSAWSSFSLSLTRNHELLLAWNWTTDRFCFVCGTEQCFTSVLTSSEQAGFSRAPLSPALPVSEFPLTSHRRVSTSQSVILNLSVCSLFFLAVCRWRGALVIFLEGEGSLFHWSQLKTLSLRWIP